MRCALIDNATITAVQRLTGHIEVSNLYQTDGDIAALEQMIQAILFYDQIVLIDDYKEEFRADRIKAFSNFLPLPENSFSYDLLMQVAEDFTADFLLKIRSGELEDSEFKKFFELLKMLSAFTWKMASSQFFLAMSMLTQAGETDGLDKYSTLMEMIFSELSEKNENSNAALSNARCELIDSSGEQVPAQRTVHGRDYIVGPQVWAFAASLNWLSLRTAFYALSAQALGADAILHPIRQAFYLRFAKAKFGMPSSVYQPIARAMSEEVERTVTQIREATEPLIFSNQLPIFTAYLAQNAHNPRRYIEVAYELRSSEPIRSMRSQLVELEQLYEQGHRADFVREINRVLRSMNATSQRLLADYGVGSPQGVPLSGLMSVLNLPLRLKTGLSIPDFGWKIAIPKQLRSMRDRSGFGGAFRSLSETLVGVERLGKLHESITSAVVKAEHADYRPAKIEQARFKGRDSDWKQWM